ncbi:MAG: AbrB/MazE/SpoVT family DNA-binding domain-containing protein [Myxococcaceae bacterium]
MAETATTIMSSKGQVVIPEKIRENLHLKKGTEFVVVSSGDALILKPIIPPSAEQFMALLEQARKEAKEVGLQRSDLEQALLEVRKRR